MCQRNISNQKNLGLTFFRPKREYLVSILTMHKRHFHFLSVVADRLQDGPAACLQLQNESESAVRALLKCKRYSLFGINKILVQNFWVKLWIQKSFGSKRILGPKSLGQKDFGPKIYQANKITESKILSMNPKEYWIQNVGTV